MDNRRGDRATVLPDIWSMLVTPVARRIQEHSVCLWVLVESALFHSINDQLGDIMIISDPDLNHRSMSDP